MITPFLLSWIGCVGIPKILWLQPLAQWWVLAIGVLLSFALNSRLGRDAEELTSEWLGHMWHNLTARFVMALIDSIMDLFKTILGLIERLLYAVDEWLRFHSGESWLTVIVKAVVGVLWSFVAFLIRVYINLLIEPTLHPVKHFPVVTVAHKIFFPVITILGKIMVDTMEPYLGIWLAGVVTGFNVFFLPGIFGFLVWELKENWRLYSSNRQVFLRPVIVGGHGETIPRLMRPGFHSGTLPKLFRRLRRLELGPASLKRYRTRRTQRSRLEHVQRDVRRFVERELIHLLQLIPCWSSAGLRCGRVHVASNSIQLDIHCDHVAEAPMILLMQEQSGWIAASIAQSGWSDFASSEQNLSFAHALAGFYRKCGIDLVREQLRRHLVFNHQYDINAEGLAIWPSGLFHREITVDLHRRIHVRPVPASEAATYGIVPTERSLVVFSDSQMPWADWTALWLPRENAAGDRSTPAACTVRPRVPVIG